MYQYKYGGQDGTAYQLVEAKDLVAVRTKEAAPIEELEMSTPSRSLIPNLLPVAAFPEAEVTTYRENLYHFARLIAYTEMENDIIIKAHVMKAREFLWKKSNYSVPTQI